MCTVYIIYKTSHLTKAAGYKVQAKWFACTRRHDRKRPATYIKCTNCTPQWVGDQNTMLSLYETSRPCRTRHFVTSWRQAAASCSSQPPGRMLYSNPTHIAYDWLRLRGALGKLVISSTMTRWQQYPPTHQPKTVLPWSRHYTAV